MPLTLEEFYIGHKYMFARETYEESNDKQGAQLIETTTCTHPEYGTGIYTETVIHVSDQVPFWIRRFVPSVLYITEKSWDYYPYTETVYECSIAPRFSLKIISMHQMDNGSSDNCLGLEEEKLNRREVDYIDILTDPVDDEYIEEEDLSLFKSEKTGRGPLQEGWREKTETIMCCYKVIDVSFLVFGLQTAVENYAHRTLRSKMLVGCRRTFAWIDEWFDMTLEDVKQYQSAMQDLTLSKMKLPPQREGESTEHTTSKEKNENKDELKEENKPKNKIDVKKSESLTSLVSIISGKISPPPLEICCAPIHRNWMLVKGMA